MKVPSRFDVGAASHTGCVRINNEDDYLLGALVPPDRELLLGAVADGMGGAAGGAEASRAALRGLGTVLLDGGSKEPLQHLIAAGFQAAAGRVFEQASAVPALRDMGTTLTAVCLSGDQAWLGHVGDSRAYRLRGTRCKQLTSDHAAREPENLLLRCIGAGQPDCAADVFDVDLRPGDRFVLVTDGIWSVVGEEAITRLAGRGPASSAAEALVGAALAAGGPDNASAVVVVVGPQVAGTAVVDIDLPREERPARDLIWPPVVSLRPPWWPWLLFLLAASLLVLTALRLGWGIDGWAWLRSRW